MAQRPTHIHKKYFNRRSVAQHAVAVFVSAVLLVGVANTIFAQSNTPLHSAAQSGEVGAARSALNAGADVNRRNGDGLTPLHLAARENHLEVVELLLDSGAEVDITTARPNFERQTALHIAAFQSNTDIVRLLLTRGASVETRDAKLNTPLHLAAAVDSAEIVQLLIDWNANINAINAEGAEVIDLAIEGGAVRILLLGDPLENYLKKRGVVLYVPLTPLLTGLIWESSTYYGPQVGLDLHFSIGVQVAFRTSENNSLGIEIGATGSYEFWGLDDLGRRVGDHDGFDYDINFGILRNNYLRMLLYHFFPSGDNGIGYLSPYVSLLLNAHSYNNAAYTDTTAVYDDALFLIPELGVRFGIGPSIVGQFIIDAAYVLPSRIFGALGDVPSGPDESKWHYGGVKLSIGYQFDIPLASRTAE